MSDTSIPQASSTPAPATGLARRDRFGRFGAAGALSNAAGELERRRRSEEAVQRQLAHLAGGRGAAGVDRAAGEAPVPVWLSSLRLPGGPSPALDPGSAA